MIVGAVTASAEPGEQQLVAEGETKTIFRQSRKTCVEM